jgi:hypothetical protein
MVGKQEEGKGSTEKGRSTSEACQEIHWSKADEPSDEEEVVRLDEGAVDCKEEGWRYVFIAR